MSACENTEQNEPAHFETAISATGFGKFNIILILIALLSNWSTVFDGNSLSYVVPIAQCDLGLTLEEKGYLMSIPFLGMLVSGPFWGFLTDTYGRKKIIIIGLFANAFFNVMAGLSQNFPMIISAKFLTGAIDCGSIAATTSQVTEFHSAQYRARALLYMGMAFPIAFITLPVIGIFLLTQNIYFNLIILELHSWNLFLLVCAMPAFVGGCLQIFLPESPKFLMTAGRNSEALKIFQKVYSINTGKAENTYPIKTLLEERTQETEVVSKWEAFKSGFVKSKALFSMPHVSKLLLITTMQIFVFISMSSLRLWLPQIFAAVNDYKATHNNEDASICLMLKSIQLNASIGEEKIEECFVNYDNSSVYINSMIVQLGLFLGYIFTGSVINIFGKKRFYLAAGMLASISGMSLYFSQNYGTIIALSNIFITAITLNCNVILAITVDCFPTTLRTLSSSIIMTIGRSGTIVANLLMPFLFLAGCLPPFLFLGLSALFAVILGMFLPNTDMKALQ